MTVGQFAPANCPIFLSRDGGYLVVMSMTEREAVAGLRLLVAVARADGAVNVHERNALATALEGRSGLSVDQLIDDAFDLEEEIAALRHLDAKHATFRTCLALASADGAASAEERQLLDHIRRGLGIE